MKTALITGIGRGIGKALAEKFLQEGYFVFGTAQSGSADYSHGNLKIVQLDLTDPSSIQKCVETISTSNTKINIMINNSGTLEDNDDTHVIIDKLRKTLEVNLIGAIDLTEQMLPHMNQSGHIVNISSQAGSISDVESFTHSHAPLRYPAYKISKAALNMYTRTLALRLKSEGMNVIVSSVHPGWVKTDMGGAEAPVTPEEAARDIYELAISEPETGQFWYKGEKYPW